MKTNKKSSIGLIGRGLAMGAADVVPGVSGGTIAFITGIYEELIETISNLKLGLLKTWRKEGFKAMWKEMNGGFLLALFTGIIISFISLAKLLKYLLKEHDILLWSFFFGLVLASVWLVGKTIKKWNASTITGFILGTGIAFAITLVSPSGDNENLGYLFMSGALAICAMILPGISGSFILVLLGAYATVINNIAGLIDAVKAADFGQLTDHVILLTIFALGCLFGLIAFSKLLNLAFKKAKFFILSILTGFLLGSLNKIWPWKETISTRINSKGEEVPLVEKNVLPHEYTQLTGESSQLVWSVLLAVTGILIIVLLDRFSRTNDDQSAL